MFYSMRSRRASVRGKRPEASRKTGSRRREQEKSQVALENIGPGVGDHAGAQIAPPGDQRAVQNSQRHDHDDLFPALIGVGQAKNRALQNDGGHDAASKRLKLPLKVSA